MRQPLPLIPLLWETGEDGTLLVVLFALSNPVSREESKRERFRVERSEYIYALESSSRGDSENVRSIIPLKPCNSGFVSFVGASTSCERKRNEINSETLTVRSLSSLFELELE